MPSQTCFFKLAFHRGLKYCVVFSLDWHLKGKPWCKCLILALNNPLLSSCLVKRVESAFSQLLKDQKFDAFITKMSPAEFKTYWESYVRVSALCRCQFSSRCTLCGFLVWHRVGPDIVVCYGWEIISSSDVPVKAF